VLEECDIGVHVFDDSSDDETSAAVQRLKAQTGIDISYTRNVPALGHDANVIRALTAPDADFVWLLADAAYVEPAELKSAFHHLKAQDFLFANSRTEQDAEQVEAVQGEKFVEFISQRAWDFTNTGATIYSRRVIAWWRSVEGRRTYQNFPQLSVILGYTASATAVDATWLGKRTVRVHPGKASSYWLSSAIDVWCKDWYDVVFAHRSIFRADTLASVLRSHCRHTRYLSAKHLLAMRSLGKYSRQVWRRYRTELVATSTAPASGLALLAHMPQSLARTIMAQKPKWSARFLPPALKH
jgi:glycosyltransferase involved in cell wall biosynthesis